MLLALGIVLVIFWVMGFVVMKTASAAIHLLLAFALISFLGHVLHGARRVDSSSPIV